MPLGFATSDDDLPLVATITLPEIEIQENITTITSGWRLEKNSDGYYRWRWQRKENGKPLTYQTESGKTGYKRGYKYIGRKKPEGF